KADDERLFLVAEAFRRGWQQQEIQDLTKIDWWFLDKVEGIVKFEAIIAGESELTYETLYQAKRKGFTDRSIAEIRSMGQTDSMTT
ncbi:hypothetical protein H6F38_34030, partial [Paenibacillus sp. EKM208P]